MKVRWFAEAHRESERALAWYSAERTALGDALLDEINKAIHELLEAPERWPLWHPPAVRCYVFQRFPYLLFYRCDGDTLTLVAFVHQRRHPARFP
jgi:toxin ParE1/3/4